MWGSGGRQVDVQGLSGSSGAIMAISAGLRFQCVLMVKGASTVEGPGSGE